MSKTDWIKEHCKSIKRLASQDPITLDDLTLIWKYANAIELARTAETEEATWGSEPNADGQTEVMEYAV